MSKEIIKPEIVEKLRKERFDRLKFFVESDKVPENARNMFVLMTAIAYLETFYNCSLGTMVSQLFLKLISNKIQTLKIDCWFFWNVKILRKSDEEIDEMIANGD